MIPLLIIAVVLLAAIFGALVMMAFSLSGIGAALSVLAVESVERLGRNAAMDEALASRRDEPE